MQTRPLYSLACLTALALCGCAKDSTSVLTDKRWMLVQIDDFPLTLSSYSPTTQSYLKFAADGKRTVGLGPCNSFSGQYSLGGSGQQLSISAQAATKATCGGQNIEDKYLTILPLTARFEIVGQELRLYDASAAQPRLLFKQAPQ
ncbi:META domain-containing protein [Hymenobacter sp. BT683]|uniref:META domain-containing protein n=1 Tax=Hymenobacter jeongseonensis TaxID=2791027 RepID=A0ABS0IDB0_9BACT|nr:META domain-containing protein [Hymenobacter jeongseonensis]MBF9236342.1 META domain-containing protein [Hymenobacter jeongseonensis]